VMPHEPGVSWQAHFGGAVAGLLAAWLFRRSDAQAPRRRYSWELEDEAADATNAALADPLELPRPEAVPVLWDRTPPTRGHVVVRLPRRD
jgi:hypothetical protein